MKIKMMKFNIKVYLEIILFNFIQINLFIDDLLRNLVL